LFSAFPRSVNISVIFFSAASLIISSDLFSCFSSKAMLSAASTAIFCVSTRWSLSAISLILSST